ncbi:MAG: hypothetical protein KGL39_57230, partial [Patescibacteria group bacterium]|nr:hypothetical protein [Patescibacteria group bacterium]
QAYSRLIDVDKLVGTQMDEIQKIKKSSRWKDMLDAYRSINSLKGQTMGRAAIKLIENNRVLSKETAFKHLNLSDKWFKRTLEESGVGGFVDQVVERAEDLAGVHNKLLDELNQPGRIGTSGQNIPAMFNAILEQYGSDLPPDVRDALSKGDEVVSVIFHVYEQDNIFQAAYGLAVTAIYERRAEIHAMDEEYAKIKASLGDIKAKESRSKQLDKEIRDKDAKAIAAEARINSLNQELESIRGKINLEETKLKLYMSSSQTLGQIASTAVAEVIKNTPLIIEINGVTISPESVKTIKPAIQETQRKEDKTTMKPANIEDNVGKPVTGAGRQGEDGVWVKCSHCKHVWLYRGSKLSGMATCTKCGNKTKIPEALARAKEEKLREEAHP